MNLKGEVSKKVFEYLNRVGIEVSEMSCRDMKMVSEALQVKFSYIKMLKSRYGKKRRMITRDDYCWAVDKFNEENYEEFVGMQKGRYDIFDKFMKDEHKKIMCDYLSDLFGYRFTVRMFDRFRREKL